MLELGVHRYEGKMDRARTIRNPLRQARGHQNRPKPTSILIVSDLVCTVVLQVPRPIVMVLNILTGPRVKEAERGSSGRWDNCRPGCCLTLMRGASSDMCELQNGCCLISSLQISHKIFCHAPP